MAMSPVWGVDDGGAVAGDKLHCGMDSGGCGHRRRAPTWDMDGGTTSDDTLVPGSRYLVRIT
uniref:Uncharacterized protein n=1 Tax=Oryza glumipatula TaxID=40148 RepID=A0A0D9ZS15_9ORYZ